MHALGDMTGQEVMRAVIERTPPLPNVRIWENTFTLDLLTHEGACRGAIVATQHGGKMLVWAKQTILATGGCGQIYRESTNPPVATGDGHAMAYRAGAQLRDMEFMQFHPTVLYIAGGSRSLITEAMRGEGGWLVDKDGCAVHAATTTSGPSCAARRRLAGDRQPDGEDAAPVRVSRRHAPRAAVRAASGFPASPRPASSSASTSPSDKIPVRPGAHYMIGGVTVDLRAARRFPACGRRAKSAPAACTAPTGWRRTACWKGWCMARMPARRRRRRLREMQRRFPRLSAGKPGRRAARRAARPGRHPQLAQEPDVAAVRRAARPAPALAEARQAVDQWRRYVLARQFDDIDGWELQNMLTLARVMIQAALVGEESRGVHLRTDFPKLDDAHWNKHLWFERDRSAARRNSGERLVEASETSCPCSCSVVLARCDCHSPRTTRVQSRRRAFSNAAA